MADDRKNDGLSRRAWLGGAAMVIGGGAGVLTASTEAYAKVAQAMAKYQDMPKDGKKCSGCAQFKPPNACAVVEGEIKPDGWCQFYVAKAG